MATQRQPERLTVDDYLALPDDGNRYELLEGDLVLLPSPNVGHQDVVLNLALLLTTYVRGAGRGRVFIAPLDVILAHRVVVQPDLLFVSNENAEIVLPQHLRGAPDLVIEVVSPASAKRDLLNKRRIYARYSVANYWIVDPEDHEIVAFTLHDSEYVEAAAATGEAAFSAPPFPELTLPLAEVWPRD